MDKLWSPWRSKYIESFKPGAEKVKDCLFCMVIKENNDEKNLILYRGITAYIIMNLFPYNSGHLMIVPYKHTRTLNELDDATNLECIKLINLGCEALNKTIFPHGFNIGINISRCSGAGIEDHIHYHVVPRWEGDTNFMPVLNDVKIVSDLIEENYRKLKEAVDSLQNI
jgi:ATP adenylyltransferase